jgi:hypothetical protein
VSGQSAGHKVTLLKASHRQIFPANVPELWKLTMGEKKQKQYVFLMFLSGSGSFSM